MNLTILMQEAIIFNGILCYAVWVMREFQKFGTVHVYMYVYVRVRTYVRFRNSKIVGSFYVPSQRNLLVARNSPRRGIYADRTKLIRFMFVYLSVQNGQKERGGREGLEDIDVSTFVHHLEFKSRDADVPVSTESDASNTRLAISI